ncbi:hypothetical protein PF002_g31554 [Phytophthora fragariae]|uniref:Uncharacterized protein n=1 Tax=Phytophthora fragariae TaxID=53985 RepID=A0A6A3VBQ3_9STRA|nr:hypothetical protein PF002_g31554 [Phytophthora fragariae]
MRLAQTSKDAPPSGVEVKKAHRLWEPTLQAVRTVANVPHRKCLRAHVQPGCTTKRYATKQGLIACARGKNPPATARNALRAHVQPGCTKKRYAIKPGLIACARGLNPPAIKRKICPRPGLDKTRSAEPGSALEANGAASQRAKLRKSRSGTEALLVVSAGQTQELETTVETLSVLTCTNTGLRYKKMKLENPPTLASELTSLPVTSTRRFAHDLHDGRIEQICILSDVERMKCEAEELKQLVAEGVDALSAKSKKERSDEQSWDSLKSSPFYEVLPRD